MLTTPNLQAYAAQLERQAERGRYLLPDVKAWLTRVAFPERHAFWLECLLEADLDGVVCYVGLPSWQRFDTPKKCRYLLRELEQRGVVEVLADGYLKVVA